MHHSNECQAVFYFAFSRQRVCSNSRIMRGMLSPVLLVVLDGLTKEHCIAVYLFEKSVMALVKRSGLLFTAMYLKLASSADWR